MTENKLMEEGVSALFNSESFGESSSPISELVDMSPNLEDGFPLAGTLTLDKAASLSPDVIEAALHADASELVTIDSMSQAMGLPRVGLVGHHGGGRGLTQAMAAALAVGLDSSTIVAPPFNDALIPNLSGAPLGNYRNLLTPQRMTVGASASSKKKRKAKKQARKKSRK